MVVASPWRHVYITKRYFKDCSNNFPEKKVFPIDFLLLNINNLFFSEKKFSLRWAKSDSRKKLSPMSPAWYFRDGEYFLSLKKFFFHEFKNFSMICHSKPHLQNLFQTKHVQKTKNYFVSENIMNYIAEKNQVQGHPRGAFVVLKFFSVQEFFFSKIKIF